MLNFKERYIKKVIPAMKDKFGYGNDMAVPKIEKVIINVGIGSASGEAERVEEIVSSLREITGQNPVKTKAKKAISGFKIRAGQEVGIKITLRGKRMWHFIDRLVDIAFPRTRDFQGIDSSKSIDSSGNLNVGIKEHIVFPEIHPEKVKNIFSFQINVATTAKNKKEGKELFKSLGFPLKDEN
ncbi:50S ribosomal protein L5 [bacterium BMS3Abin15]|nr:50S ribosomal protein L5 [bacterium BMS3Abin15]HDZ85016.1 50S ribosomal protein L5 [Candidatus Moranbacteria bacterium]